MPKRVVGRRNAGATVAVPTGRSTGRACGAAGRALGPAAAVRLDVRAALWGAFHREPARGVAARPGSNSATGSARGMVALLARAIATCHPRGPRPWRTLEGASADRRAGQVPRAPAAARGVNDCKKPAHGRGATACCTPVSNRLSDSFVGAVSLFLPETPPPPSAAGTPGTPHRA